MCDSRSSFSTRSGEVSTAREREWGGEHCERDNGEVSTAGQREWGGEHCRTEREWGGEHCKIEKMGR